MRLNSSSYTTTYGIFIAQSEKKPKPPNSSSRNRRGLCKRDCSVSSRPKLPSHRYKPMHVFALYRGGILASMVKQIMGLGNLIPCPNSFPKQVVAYLLFLLLPCKWKGWTQERMNRERPMLGFVALDVKRRHMDRCPVTGNVFPSLIAAPITISGQSLQW